MNLSDAFSAALTAPRRLLRAAMPSTPPPPFSRGAVGMIFKRSPLLLVVAAMMALSGLFVHEAPPASADHDDIVTVWSATLTVEDDNLGILRGCDNMVVSSQHQNCSDSTALTSNSFTQGGTTYVVDALVQDIDSGSIDLALNKAIPAAWGGTHALRFDGVLLTFRAGTAGDAVNTGDMKAWRWVGTGHSVRWTDGQKVQVELLRMPRPSGVELSTDKLEINEDSTGSGTFTVKLSADPGAETTVTLVRTQYFQSEYGESGHVWDLNAATVSPETLTFTSGASGNWGTAQTVTVTGVEDDDGCDEQLLILLLSEGGPVGGSSNSVTGVFVTVEDDDTVGCGGI